MWYPWTWLKSSEDNDKAAQREQDDAFRDEDVDNEQFESDWEHSKDNNLTEDEIWRSRPKAVPDGMDDPNLGFSC
jgi:hypothetical protein